MNRIRILYEPPSKVLPSICVCKNNLNIMAVRLKKIFSWLVRNAQKWGRRVRMEMLFH